MHAPQVILATLLLYAACGALFATAFLARGMAAIDRATKGSGWGFRILVIPGIAALWPLLLAKWIRTGRSL